MEIWGVPSNLTLPSPSSRATESEGVKYPQTSDINSCNKHLSNGVIQFLKNCFSQYSSHQEELPPLCQGEKTETNVKQKKIFKTSTLVVCGGSRCKNSLRTGVINHNVYTHDVLAAARGRVIFIYTVIANFCNFGNLGAYCKSRQRSKTCVAPSIICVFLRSTCVTSTKTQKSRRLLQINFLSFSTTTNDKAIVFVRSDQFDFARVRRRTGCHLEGIGSNIYKYVMRTEPLGFENDNVSQCSLCYRISKLFTLNFILFVNLE
ncbi:unnamed protein product [Trichogramma brassicae]|uniref:Uncharacterized protein n=1 Tax=Trichogramma brassicae TaxID=86971 RepID=A0A6H5IHD6_9HYME|nr:unnamed protein product [Trichogramma brassicae]